MSAHTTLLYPLLTVDLHSAFVSGHNTDTHAIHLLLGPERFSERVIRREYDCALVNVIHQPERCLLEHWYTLIELCGELGHRIRIDAPTSTGTLSAAVADSGPTRVWRPNHDASEPATSLRDD